MSGCASPKILQRRIHNQLLSLPSTSQLSLLRTNLLPTHRYLSAVVTQFQLHSMLITSLDCHFCILNESSISTLCQCLVNLKELKIVDCGLKELERGTPWPISLRSIDFSRNQLTECPQGLSSLVYLTTLNLSGNKIELLDPSLLRLPLLEKFHLVRNPIQNIPKSICRQGVDKMREYFKVETLPLPPQSSSSNCSASVPNSRKSSNSMCDFERHQDLRLFLLRQQGSFDSGYESVERCRTTSGSSIDTCDSDSTPDHTQRFLPKPFPLPSGYSSAINTNLCQVYLPEGCADQVCIEFVKDLSLYPKVESNELLITPVVQISPHGRKFCPHQPAIVVLPHCTKPEYDSDGGQAPRLKQRLVPVYSDSVLNQPASWSRLDYEHSCEIFEDHVLFRTTHFSLFAVLSILPYPSASISVGPNYGGILTVAELPGFEVNLPPTSSGREVTVTATVYYDDAPYNIESDGRTLASPCVGLEPHGAQFDTPVQIALPIPRYTEVLMHFPDAKLKLWHTTRILYEGAEARVQPLPEDWEQFQSSQTCIQERAGYRVIVFTTNHFSWWETLWDIGRRALQKVGLVPAVVSSRTRYVSVRIQALMSLPVRVGPVGAAEIQTFGLLVAVYKFGSPLSHQSNYPWSLLDTGTKRIYLQIGQLEVSVQGNFLPMEYEDPTNPLSRSTELIDFNGDDFCQRFEFALQLKQGCEVCRGMVMGKLLFKQWNGSTPSDQNYNLVVECSPTETGSPNQPAILSQVAPPTPCQPLLLNNPDFTPPWSPDSDAQMDSEEVFPNALSTSSSAFHSSAHQQISSLPRKRSLSFMHTSSHPTHGNISGGVKRRLLCRQGDIDEKTLLRVADAVGSKYTELGIELGLNYKWIQSNIENKANMTRDNLKALCILHEWKSRAGEEFSYSELAKALEADQIGLRSVANQICYTTS